MARRSSNELSLNDTARVPLSMRITRCKRGRPAERAGSSSTLQAYVRKVAEGFRTEIRGDVLTGCSNSYRVGLGLLDLFSPFNPGVL